MFEAASNSFELLLNVIAIMVWRCCVQAATRAS